MNTTRTPSAHSGEGKPSDWAIARAYWDFVNVSEQVNRFAGGHNGTTQVIEQRARELERQHEQSKPCPDCYAETTYASGIDETEQHHCAKHAPPPSEQAGISDEVVLPPLPTSAVFDPGRFGVMFSGAQMEEYARASIKSAFPRSVGSGGRPQVTSTMVQRFLGWRLPDTFAPDCYISFDKEGLKRMGNGSHWPVGTNLFTDPEARAMLEYVLATSTTEAVDSNLRVQYDALKDALHDEIAANLAFREAGGALPDEDMPTFCARLISERSTPQPPPEAGSAKDAYLFGMMMLGRAAFDYFTNAGKNGEKCAAAHRRVLIHMAEVSAAIAAAPAPKESHEQ